MTKFRNFDNEEIDLIEQIENSLKSGYDYKIYIGTDSQLHKNAKKTVYATAVVLHKQNRGGRCFVKKRFQRRKVALSERLKNEVWYSLETALEIAEEFSENVEIVVHIDCNNSMKHKSGQYKEQLIGMIVGQGFKCCIKPEAFAAQSVANKFSR